jgi:hypothetical protein
MGGDAPAAPMDAVAQAHRALLGDNGLQFDFAAFKPPPPPPEWLKRLLQLVGKALTAAWPAIKVVFWIGLAVIVGLILYFIGRELVARVRGGRRGAKAARPADLPGEWRPSAARARALLEDADRLAGEGRFEEAVHLILFRSIDDIDARWPRLLRPALTSRDIAAHEALPAAARETFGGIARMVERSFFGGAALGRSDFATCRAAYEAFALAGRA